MSKTIICCYCGHHELGDDNTNDRVHFPDRFVYKNNESSPWECPKCGNNNDVVIFGKNYISGLFSNSMFKILELNVVKASNVLWKENQNKKVILK